MMVQKTNVTKVLFIGKAWINHTKEVKDTAGNVTKAPREYIRILIDNGLQLNFKEKDSIELWPNTKREGKQDADYRVSVRIPEDNK